MSTEDQLLRCPAGNLYDPLVHAVCPCPNCWADRASASLGGAHKNVEAEGERPYTKQKEASTEATASLTTYLGGEVDLRGREPHPAEVPTSLWRRLSFQTLVFLIVTGIAAVGVIGYFHSSGANSSDEALFAAARGDINKLEKYLKDCVTCRHKAEVEKAITFLQQQASEQSKYLGARGDSKQLQAYADTCKVCAFKAEAIEEVSYLTARGSAQQLAAYVTGCKTCEFSVAARSEIKELEYAQKVFDLEFCNQTSDQVAVATAARINPDSSDLSVAGWLLIDAHSCKKRGKFARGNFFAVALVNNSRKGWYGKEKHCVEFPGPFERIETTNYACPSGGRVVGFREFNVTSDKYTWTLSGSPSFADEDFFALEICNRSTYDASVAIAGRRVPGSSDWTVEGWWPVSAGACGKLGRFALGKFYVTAKVRNEPKGWFGTDTRQCVEFPGPFSRNVSASTSCPSEGRMFGFLSVDVGQNNYTWSITGTPSFAEDEFFSFEVCNKSSKRASVAVMARADPIAEFEVQGWHTVAADSCKTVGRFARGTFYAMASEWGHIDRGWWQKDIHLCVAVPGPFNRTNSPNYKCAGNERLVPFRRFSVNSPKLSWTLN